MTALSVAIMAISGLRPQDTGAQARLLRKEGRLLLKETARQTSPAGRAATGADLEAKGREKAREAETETATADGCR